MRGDTGFAYINGGENMLISLIQTTTSVPKTKDLGRFGMTMTSVN
ncbi:hypothetical protein PS834_00951 [Pseudomonas fluorescens]|nr:hypothetical protein PS834_00951 [Pseudomonas fluorescens]